MESISIETKKGFKINIKGIFRYLWEDKIGICFFILLILKAFLFLNVLMSNGASEITFELKMITFDNFCKVALFSMLFISFTYIFKKRAHLWALVTFNLLFSILLIGDLWYYRGFKSFLSFHLLSETQNLNNLSSSVMSMARPVDLIFLIDVLLMIVLAIVYRKYYKELPKIRGTFIVLFTLALGLMMFIYGPGLFKRSYIPCRTMKNLSPIGYHIYDTAELINDNRPYSLNEKEKKNVEQWLSYKNESLPDNKYKGIFAGKNLVVIQVESLENFVVNNKYGDEEITPNINKMLKNSLYFSNYYEQVYNGTSSDADLMNNAGVYPVRRGSTFFRFPKNQYNTLPMILKNKGYYSQALHSDYGYYWNVEKALTNFGFNEFKDCRSFDSKDYAPMGIIDGSFFNEVANRLGKNQKPFYTFAVTCTSHSPFDLRPNLKGLKLDEGIDSTHLGRYFQCINYTDREIGKFIDNLDKKGLLDNTVVVICGDHTGVHKYYPDEIAKLKPQQSWWNEKQKIPLIIYSKGMEGKEFKINGGQVDFLPTIAYALGIEKSLYENTTLGRNLLNTSKSFALLSEGEIIGKEGLSKTDIEHINKSYEISDMVIRANYFKKK